MAMEADMAVMVVMAVTELVMVLAVMERAIVEVVLLVVLLSHRVLRPELRLAMEVLEEDKS
jgi:hypothetical protein